MKKAILIKTNLTIDVVELPEEDASFNDMVHKLIDCELYEPAGLLYGYVALVDESGKLKLKHMNHLATVLYPSMNDILVGDVLITKIGYEDGDSSFVSLSDADITMLKNVLQRTLNIIREGAGTFE